MKLLLLPYVNQELSTAYVLNEREKKKEYNERVLNVEHGSFTPPVMSATGRECRKFYTRLAERLIIGKAKAKLFFDSDMVTEKNLFCLHGINFKGAHANYPNMENKDTIATALDSDNELHCTNDACIDDEDQYKLECRRCNCLAHYYCTKLPLYEISLFLTKGYLRCICKNCVDIPDYLTEMLTVQQQLGCVVPALE